MNCLNPVTITKTVSPLVYPNGLEVPCGKCTNCRIQKTREWSMRLLHEKVYWKDSIFVTLTYDDNHLPYKTEKSIYPTLRKTDAQNFIKRLRRQLDTEQRKIKYFLCGEYGDQTQRPHYHAIIFGVSLKDRELIKKCWKFCDWNNVTISKKSFGLAETDSIRYVAQYIDKKYTGPLAEKEYDDKLREPVFRLLSLGMGKQYCFDNASQIKEREHITVRGIKNSIPRYYIKKLELDLSNIKQNAIYKQCETVEHYTGLNTTQDALLATQCGDVIGDYFDKLYKAKKQHDLNLKARININVLKHSKF